MLEYLPDYLGEQNCLLSKFSMRLWIISNPELTTGHFPSFRTKTNTGYKISFYLIQYYLLRIITIRDYRRGQLMAWK